ncbi:beta-lactamase family protein [Jatrophihabitans cynanchi]|uniref:Beta-lactamase family protein n=1 Tax=Jatrophihabitans cynanchi TaxID=2944128 RepID=A0ABY7JWN9_9ACTN|nr:serine hydrolase domain-containing protein [Jatrophihabitans sp. SB3-54]WAX55747.1 beta-lactamase family protein [Jatrophihabitans sp. SB3-54]
MSNLNEIKTWLEGRLPALLAENEVPGAAVAVYAGGEVVDLAGGVLSKATGVEATADSLFQIGSITKVWTTTLVMQLVDEGLVELDEPVRTYLPEFVISDESAAKVITVRQLLSHQAGFEGDIFTDTGMGDDCVEKYVATLSDVDQLFAPGEMFSYNNAGFCVLGRMVEVLRGKPYDSCLREHLFTPLALTHAANGANEAILFRAAVGHIRPEPDAAPVPAPVWSLVRSNAPAGSSLAMRPRDLLAFAQLHLHSGTAADGTQVLSAASVKAMQERQVEVPDLGLMGNAWGLGWELFDWDGGPVIGHDGGTIGQSAFLRVVPEQNIAVALLTNGGDTFAVYTEIFGHVLRELAGIAMPALPTPPAEQLPFDAARFLGTYSCEVGDLTVSQDDEGRLWLQTLPKGAVAELVGESERVELLYLRENTLIPAKPDRGVHLPNVFLGDDGTGRALYLHAGRAIRRASPA